MRVVRLGRPGSEGEVAVLTTGVSFRIWAGRNSGRRPPQRVCAKGGGADAGLGAHPAPAPR